MRVCVFCKTCYKMDSGITFHKFPSDDSKKLLWMKNMNIKNWEPKSNSHLCSKHFTKDCFIKHAARTTLKNGSVPTVFIENTSSAVDDTVVTPIPCISGTTVEIKLEPISINIDHNNANTEGPSSSGTEKKPTIVHDHHYENTPLRTSSEIFETIKHDHRYENAPRSSERELQRVKKALKMSRSHVKVLKQQVKRLKARLSRLKTVNNELKKSKLIGGNCAFKLDLYNDVKPELY